MEKGKFVNIGFAILESHLHFKENPKASGRCDTQFLSFHLFQNAGFHLQVDCVCRTKVVTERMESIM